MPNDGKHFDEEEKVKESLIMKGYRCRSLDVYELNRFAPIDVYYDYEDENENESIDNFIQNQL